MIRELTCPITAGGLPTGAEAVAAKRVASFPLSQMTCRVSVQQGKDDTTERFMAGSEIRRSSAGAINVLS